MSVDCGFGEGLLSSSQRLTSGSVRILYTSRQASWAGKALGKPEKFIALLQPAGICDCLRSPSPFCSMIVPSIGTSMVAFRLICARLAVPRVRGEQASLGQFPLVLGIQAVL